MIKHCFFGNNCEIDRGLSDYSNLITCLKGEKWNFKGINFVNQIHSNEVYVIDSELKIQGKQGLKKADAIVTNQKNLAIAVVTADCAPIILKDENMKVAAVVHAGWKGAKNGVIQNAIDAMTCLGSNIDSIESFVGPMIHQGSYQVSKEFYDDFLILNENNFKFFKEDLEKDKYLFDLTGFVEDVLRKQGVKKIENIGIDTYKSSDHASYRRATHSNSNLSKRNISAVML